MYKHMCSLQTETCSVFFLFMNMQLSENKNPSNIVWRIREREKSVETTKFPIEGYFVKLSGF